MPGDERGGSGQPLSRLSLSAAPGEHERLGSDDQAASAKSINIYQQATPPARSTEHSRASGPAWLLAAPAARGGPVPVGSQHFWFLWVGFGAKTAAAGMRPRE